MHKWITWQCLGKIWEGHLRNFVELAWNDPFSKLNVFYFMYNFLLYATIKIQSIYTGKNNVDVMLQFQTLPQQLKHFFSFFFVKVIKILCLDPQNLHWQFWQINIKYSYHKNWLLLWFNFWLWNINFPAWDVIIWDVFFMFMGYL